ncbi:MAG TPA: pitrilysin family protein [Acidobacteriota bacterium]|nr:pitrilysin family protein [Acidobacteriota bacterium]
MKSRTLHIFLIFLFALCSLPLFAEKETPPEGGKPKDFQLPAKQTKTLANGLGAVLVPYGTTPKATVSVIVKTGNLHEGAQQVWLAELTAQTLKEGAAGMDTKAIARKAAAMGGEINVQIGPEDTRISGSVLSEYTPDLIRLLADVVTRPSFPESEVERVKKDMKRDLSVQKAVPQAQALEKFTALMFGDHPYGRQFPTEEMLDSYNTDRVKAFYGANFGAVRTKVYVVGKFDSPKAMTAIEQSFGSWIRGPEVSYPPAKPSHLAQKATVERAGAPQTTIMFGTPVIDPSNPDYVALRVANALLGGSFGSRITRNIREDKGYTYSPSGVLQAGYRTAYWYELADVTSEHTADSLREIQKEIERLQNEPPSAEELKGIQNYVAGVFVLQNSSQQGIIAQLHFQDLHGLGDDYLSNYVKKVYAVTPEKVQQLIRDQIKKDEMTLVMVGDSKQIEAQFQTK